MSGREAVKEFLTGLGLSIALIIAMGFLFWFLGLLKVSSYLIGILVGCVVGTTMKYVWEELSND